jgi:phosphoglycolate phosphatase-like HAD superfamily hydrolase
MTQPSAIKILSDFDGVWTDQALEAEYVRRFAIDALAHATGSSAAVVEGDWNAFVRTTKAEPHAHGWAPDGRITAYVDEDPLCEGSAVCRLLDHATEATAVRYREAIGHAGHASLAGFGEHCFHGGTARFRAEHPPCIVPDAKDMLRALTAAGADIVVVSNSATEKLVAFFAAAGIHAVDHDTGERGELRVRGNAGKWFLGPTDASITVAGRHIHVDRPRYRAVIVDERPDIVIGDVFSLDLALPHVMRGAGNPKAPRTLVLRRHPHTPAWITADRAHGAIDAVVDQVGDIVDVIARREA